MLISSISWIKQDGSKSRVNRAMIEQSSLKGELFIYLCVFMGLRNNYDLLSNCKKCPFSYLVLVLVLRNFLYFNHLQSCIRNSAGCHMNLLAVCSQKDNCSWLHCIMGIYYSVDDTHNISHNAIQQDMWCTGAARCEVVCPES